MLEAAIVFLLVTNTLCMIGALVAVTKLRNRVNGTLSKLKSAFSTD